jgi:hypothetical protein
MCSAKPGLFCALRRGFSDLNAKRKATTTTGAWEPLCWEPVDWGRNDWIAVSGFRLDAAGHCDGAVGGECARDPVGYGDDEVPWVPAEADFISGRGAGGDVCLCAGGLSPAAGDFVLGVWGEPGIAAGGEGGGDEGAGCSAMD